MNVAEILKGLDSPHEEIPADLLRAAVEQREEITPGLIAAIDDVASSPQFFIEHPERALYFWATYLLVHFEEPRALPAILRLFDLNSSQFRDLVREMVASDGGFILANVAGENIDALARILQDKSAPESSREAAANAMGYRCAWGVLDSSYIEGQYREALLSLKPSQEWLATVISNNAADLNLRGLAPEITLVHERGLIDPDDFDFIAEWMNDPGFEGPPPFIVHIQGIDDIVEFFEEREREEAMIASIASGKAADDLEDPDLYDIDDFDEPIMGGNDLGVPLPPSTEPGRVIHSGGQYRSEPKIGRNAPCPCGSGKKYKNCCGGKGA